MIISFVNQKGGVGKSTACMNIGVGLSKEGLKVCCIDLDPQAHLTYYMTGKEPDQLSKSIYNVLCKNQPITKQIVHTRYFDLIPSNIELSGAEVEMLNTVGRESILERSLRKLHYDLILIDCPPNLGILTVNALTASTDVLIPLSAEYFSLKGMSRLLQTIEIVRERLNPALNVAGIIVTRYDSRKKICAEVIEQINEYFAEKLFKSQIRDNVKITESPSHCQSIYDYAPDSIGAEDYSRLVQEIKNTLIK